MSTSAGETWTTRKLQTWMSEAFTKAEIDAPRLMGEMLLEHVLCCDRLKLYTDPDRPASPDELANLRELARRALRHEPVQYLVGEAWFYGLRFGCDARALVPRACSEVIVQRVIEDWKGRDEETKRRRVERDGETERRRDEGCRGLSESLSEGHAGACHEATEAQSHEGVAPASSRSDDDLANPEDPEQSRGLRRRASSDHATNSHDTNDRETGPLIADVCTGSGCIAIALAKGLPGARLIATDVSPEALELARENAGRLGVADRVEFRQGDLLGPLGEFGGCLDYLVSNPPYIPDEEWADVPSNVKDFEPGLALRGGSDGMDLVRPILELGPALLKPGGRVLVEVAMSRAEAARDMLAGIEGVGDVRIHKDQDGLLRVVEGVCE